MAEALKGRVLAASIHEKTKARIEKLGNPPGLAILLVGDDPASHLYVNLKEKAAKDVGIYFEKHLYDADVSTKKLVKDIKKLNKRDDIHGILVQLPLPDQDEDEVIQAIDWKKDVDGFHPKSRQALQKGEPGLVPPVSLAIMRLIDASRQPLKGKTATIIANNEIFASPLITLLEERGVGAQFVSSGDSAIAAKARAADIIIVAVGKLDFITTDMVKDGAIVIDVGTNKKDGKTVGDVAPEVNDVAGFLSSVPGGVGPLTVVYLLTNVLKATLLKS